MHAFSQPQFLKKLFDKLVPAHLPLPAKILKYTCLVIVCSSGVVIPINAAIGFPLQLNLVIVLSTLFVLRLFIKMPLYSHYNQTGFFLILAELVTLSINWFFNGGLFSSAPYYFLLLIGFAAIILTGGYLLSSIFLCVGCLTILIFLESWHPEWLTPLPKYSWQLNIDIIFSIAFLGSLLAWFVSKIIHINQQQYEEVKEASHAKSLFLSQLSHELRTPLNSVIGFSKILKRQTLTPAQVEFAERIHVNGLHLLALVNQIMDLSIIETNKVNLDRQSVNLIQLLREVESVIMLEAQQKQLDFRLRLPAYTDAIHIYTDPNRLRQIVINLINNAIKFTETGHVICRLQETTDALFIEVEDTGSGIPIDRQNAIFEPLFRLEKHHQIEGKGIGLSITQTLCSHLGYTIELLKSSDAGSIFRLTMPMSEEPSF